MQGIGIVYRMFRSGSTGCDDEVVPRSVAATAPGRAYVSLVNVRYATSRLRRRGGIDQAMRDRIVTAASSLPVEERRWDLIRPGGPVSSTWSSASRRARAAFI
jgi:hypothetical protein